MSGPQPIPPSPYYKSQLIPEMSPYKSVTGKSKAWPPDGQNEHKPHSYLSRVTNDKGTRVEWPPKYSHEEEGIPQGSEGYGPYQSGRSFHPQEDCPPGFKYREEAPMDNVTHPPVVISQPAFKISAPVHVKGDEKWPPRGGFMDDFNQQVRDFIRPKKSDRDYADFFAQNALGDSHTPYRIPPGTQHRHFIEE